VIGSAPKGAASLPIATFTSHAPSVKPQNNARPANVVTTLKVTSDCRLTTWFDESLFFGGTGVLHACESGDEGLRLTTSATFPAGSSASPNIPEKDAAVPFPSDDPGNLVVPAIVVHTSSICQQVEATHYKFPESPFIVKRARSNAHILRSCAGRGNSRREQMYPGRSSQWGGVL